MVHCCRQLMLPLLETGQDFRLAGLGVVVSGQEGWFVGSRC
jgi:hypothetical protein